MFYVLCILMLFKCKRTHTLYINVVSYTSYHAPIFTVYCYLVYDCIVHKSSLIYVYVHMWRNTSYGSYETYIYVLSQTYTHNTYEEVCYIYAFVWYYLHSMLHFAMPRRFNYYFSNILVGKETNCLKSLSHMCNMI